MEELYDKVNNLIKSIDNTEIVSDIKRIIGEIEEDSKLKQLLEKYHIYKDEKVKEEIMSNELFQKYKEKEIDINIMIMMINNKLKTINNERSCRK